MARLSKANMHTVAKVLANELLASDPARVRAATKTLREMVLAPTRRKLGMIVLTLHYVGEANRANLTNIITDTAVNG
jgi:hypothetical protein